MLVHVNPPPTFRSHDAGQGRAVAEVDRARKSDHVVSVGECSLNVTSSPSFEGSGMTVMAVITGAKSSFRIGRSPWPSVIVALAALDRLTTKVLSASTRSSPQIGTWIR